MTVFKNYLKIALNHKIEILIYLSVFLVISYVYGDSLKKEGPTVYMSEKALIYATDDSKDDLSKALLYFLEKNTEFKDLDHNLVNDELFYGNIDAIIVIPKDFKNTHEIIFKTSPNSYKGIFIKEIINEFLNKVSEYQISGFSLKEAIDNSNKDLDNNIKINFNYKSSDNLKAVRDFFNLLNYPLIAQILLIIMNINLIYNKKIIKMRNDISPVSEKSRTLQIAMDHLLIGFMFRSLYIILFFLFKGELSASYEEKLIILNSFIFMISTVAMGIFVSSFIKNRNILAGVMNVIALSTSLLAGAFVPQNYLSKTALDISKIFPSYYYITNNNLIADNSKNIMFNMIIMSLFSIVFIFLSIYSKNWKLKKFHKTLK